MKLWICGRVIAVYSRKHVVWNIQGIFDAKVQAIKACKDENYFIGPLVLNKELPKKSTEWQGVVFPKKITKV